MLRRLLLLPLLSPLLAVLVVGALNPRPAVGLRLLTWSAPALPLGAWIALAGAGGAALSAGATALALGEATAPLRRQVRRRMGTQAPEPWEEELEEEREPPWQRWNDGGTTAPPPAVDAGPSRAPGDPAPTVAVPFRVLRRGEGGGGGGGAAGERVGGRPATAEPVAEPVPAGEDDWDAAASDDW